MKLSDGLFLQCCNEIAKLYPNIKCDNMIVDNTTMQLVSKPQVFTYRSFLLWFWKSSPSLAGSSSFDGKVMEGDNFQIYGWKDQWICIYMWCDNYLNLTIL